jgi:Ca2+-transporting ATPase
MEKPRIDILRDRTSTTADQDNPSESMHDEANQHTPWHAQEFAATFDLQETSRQGLSEAEAERRLTEYGLNELATGEKVSKLKIFLAQFTNPLVLVLVGAAVISFLAGKEADIVVIAVVILVNSLIGFFQEYRAEEALEKLKSQAAPEADVLRAYTAEGVQGHHAIEMRVPATKVVPGDIILLDAGDKVPADARIFQATNLEVDESMLTGESLPVHKGTEALPADIPVAERTNLVYGGTMVVEGRGRAVVVATGSQTEMGKIANLIQETEKVTSPLEQQTFDLGKKLSLLALGVALLTLVLGVVRGLALEDVFLFALASAVSSIPEGLPAVLTITLAVGVSRMARRHAIIRKLHAVDTLGAATAICSDKTGTLTTNEMTVQEFAIGGHWFEVTGAGFEPVGEFRYGTQTAEPDAHEGLRTALQIGALCNNARLIEHLHNSEATWEIRGDPTEGALIVAGAKAGYDKKELEAQFVRIDEVPFSSKSKWMATFHQAPDGSVWALVKGAPEVILDLSVRYYEDETVKPIDSESARQIHDANREMAGRALRVLGLAYQVLEPGEVAGFKEKLERGESKLTMVGLVGMIDPPRPEVPNAVQRCRNAGIRVIMATGDHQLTAEAIACEIGILRDRGQVLTGRDVALMNDEELDQAVERTDVFARVAPEHKHRIVEALRRTGNVVAMTGDGVNDAPALQAAEIGVAMGIAGTDVTKETAEMVLTDDNFASIVNAIEEGRGVFQNVRKVVKYLLTTNIGEDITLLTALAFLPGAGLIITPVQILWVNLVTDGILDITLALEPQEADLMEEPPRDRQAGIINREILKNIVYVALFMAAGTLWTFTRANGNGGLLHAQTLAFTTMAMFQVFNALNCRSRTKSVFELGFFTNRYLMGAVALSIILQVAANRLPFMQTALGTVPLSLREWGEIMMIASSVFIADELRKAFQRARVGSR